MSRCALALIGMLLWCAALPAKNASPHAQKFVEITRELRAIGIPSAGTGPTQPPIQVPGLLRKLNQSLKELIIEILNRPMPPLRSSYAWEAVVGELEAAGWEEIPRHKWNAYGELDSIDEDWSLQHEPALLVIVTRLWIPCGAADPDSVLYIFEQAGNGWKLVLATETDYDPRTENDDVGLMYRLSPPEEDGGWFLAVSTLPPTCDSRPTRVTYRILRPGSAPDEAIVVLQGREPIEMSFQPPYEMRAEMDWFSLTRGGLRRLDGDPAVFVSRWQISGNRAQRIHPLAYDPEDFLDYWIQMSWQESEPWSLPDGRQGLKEWHSKLNEVRPSSAEIVFVQPCESQGWHENWEIGVEFDRRSSDILNATNLFVRVVKERGVFYLESIQTKRPPGCPGETPPKEKLYKLPS